MKNKGNITKTINGSNRSNESTLKTINKINDRTPQIGDIYLMNFGGNGSEQSGLRPGVVFQNNVGNANSPNIIALPITSAIKKMGQPTHVPLKASDTGLRMDSIVLCENPERMSKEKLGKFIGSLSDDYMKQITEANLLATSAIAFLDVESLVAIWRKAFALNAVPA
jgi:mRNA interferase MazF